MTVTSSPARAPRRSRGAWEEAFDLLVEADTEGHLGSADLSVLGEVAYAAGHLDVTIEAWERAHASSMQDGDRLAAAGAAVRVAMHLLFDTALMAPGAGLAGARGPASGRSRRDYRCTRGSGSSVPTSGC